MVLGPLDRRGIRTRCQACARRRIKCDGGSPCVYCTKKKMPCLAQAAQSQAGAVVFLDPSSTTQPPPRDTLSMICAKVPRDPSNKLTAYFFSEFIVKNDFAGGSLDLNAISAAFQQSPSLYHASLAVAALDMSRSLVSSPAERKKATIKALIAYRTSINSFQTEIQDAKQIQNDGALWTTFFLGIFELMYDTSGAGWVKHILHGTSQILQLRGPSAHLTGRGRSFFLTVRPFEICRSLIYSEPSFLSEPEWVSLMSKMREDDLKHEFHPKEELFDLMLACSTLSGRVWDVIASIESPPDTSVLLDLASQGLVIRSSLETWHTNLQILSQPTPTPPQDPWILLATIYYHATSIYLSGLYDYRSEFDILPPHSLPSLPQTTIQHHTSSIISLTHGALKSTRLASILFFFPLRVAGARAQSPEERKLIIEMLKEISARSFVVADAFVLDLSSLWMEKGEREEAHGAWD